LAATSLDNALMDRKGRIGAFFPVPAMATAARSGQFDIVAYAPYIHFDLCRGPMSIIDKDVYTESFLPAKK
jgi:hypothetical protein